MDSRNRAVLSWALYDFANSAFATTILSVVFNVYFVTVICAGGVPMFGHLLTGETLWGLAASVSMLVTFLITPVLGAIADHSSKKKFLTGFWCLGWIFSGLLYFCAEGDWLMASLFFILANTGFTSGNTFYNAFLNDISDASTVGRISGFGWAVGYLGGGLLLAINLMMIQHPAWFHLSAENHVPVRAAFASVGAWWFVFAIPLFLWVKEKPAASAITQKFNFIEGCRSVFKTFHEIRKYREVFIFLIAFLVYNDGIETVILTASIFGVKELGFSQADMIRCFLMIQAVAFFGALLFGSLADKVGHKRSISATLWIYIGVCIWAYFMKTRAEFWILGAVVGLILGGSQAASRSLLVLLNPPEKNTEFFGFFALTGKLSTVFGPLFFALMSQLFSIRAAVGGLSMFFVLGLIILYFVREPEIA